MTASTQETTPYSAREIRQALRLIPTTNAFASAFSALTTGAVFTAFLAKFLQASDLWYGLILAAVQAAVFVQFYGSLTVERAGRVKPKYVFFSIPQRLFWLAMAAAAWFMPRIPEDIRLPLVLGMVLCASIFANLGAGGLMAWFCRIIPASTMGRFIGFRQRIGLSAMLVIAILAAFALDRFPGQGRMYAALFAFAAVIGLIDLLITYRIPEHPRPVEPDPLTMKEVVATPWRHHLTRLYLIYAFLAGAVTAMMEPFTIKYGFASRAEGGLGLNVSLGNLFLFILPMLAMAWSAPLWGHQIDRRGPRPILTRCMVGLILVSAGWLFMRPDWRYAVPLLTVAGALCINGMTQVEFYMRSVGFPDFRRSCYLAQLNVIMGMAGVVGTTLGGVLAGVWQRVLPALTFLPDWATHYHLLFFTANLLRLLLFVGVMAWLPLPSREDSIPKTVK